jgi:hypothetical protein
LAGAPEMAVDLKAETFRWRGKAILRYYHSS